MLALQELLILFPGLLFLERGRERNIAVWLPLMCSLLGTWPKTQACALSGNQTGDPLVHRPVLNPLSHTSQGSWPFLRLLFLMFAVEFSRGHWGLRRLSQVLLSEDPERQQEKAKMPRHQSRARPHTHQWGVAPAHPPHRPT